MRTPGAVSYTHLDVYKRQALQSVGIPAVGVKGAEGGDVIATLSTWLDIMGQMFGTTGNTEGVIEYANTVKQEVADKLADATEEEKPKVLYLYNHSKEQISACGSNFYGGYWIESAEMCIRDRHSTAAAYRIRLFCRRVTDICCSQEPVVPSLP